MESARVHGRMGISVGPVLGLGMRVPFTVRSYGCMEAWRIIKPGFTPGQSGCNRNLTSSQASSWLSITPLQSAVPLLFNFHQLAVPLLFNLQLAANYSLTC